MIDSSDFTETLINNEICGLCEKLGGDKFWFSPTSRAAHSSCLEKIQSIEKIVTEKLNRSFPPGSSPIEANIAHMKMIKDVRKNCGDKSIIEYLDLNGIEALEKLFIESLA